MLEITPKNGLLLKKRAVFYFLGVVVPPFSVFVSDCCRACGKIFSQKFEKKFVKNLEKSAEWYYLCIRFRPGGVRMKKKEFFKEIGRFEDAASGIRNIDAGD